MQDYPATVVLRHRKENLKKCSLRGLESREDYIFFTYPKEKLPELENYLVLDLDAPPIGVEDANLGLLIFDGTWNYAAIMAKQSEHVTKNLVKRSIPPEYRTAYPRKQEDCLDPDRGLASLEAIYIAYHLMGRSTEGLLDNYYWKDSFLTKNNFTSN